MGFGPQVRPLTNEWLSLSTPDQTVLSRTHTFHTHLTGEASVGCLNALLSVQASVSGLSTGGHEGSLSLMSLFVFFQSAASSDGGEYKIELLSFHCDF